MQPTARRSPTLLHALAALAAIGLTAAMLASTASAAESATKARPAKVQPVDPTARKELSALMGQLDSTDFEERQAARRRLVQMAARPEMAEVLAEEFYRAIAAAGTSLEVRRQLEELARTLPKRPDLRLAPASLEEIDRLIARLDDDDYAIRLGAAERLRTLAEEPSLVVPVLLRTKKRLADPAASVDARRWLEPLVRAARMAWVTAPSGGEELPSPSDEQLRAWLDAAGGSSTDPAAQHARAEAVLELRDALVRDANVPRIRKLIEQRLADPSLTPPGRTALGPLSSLTRPRMVAEGWNNGRMTSLQLLVIGEPSLAETATRPSHFDRIDDDSAHCVSGQNLTPGEYPVGVAIVHPKMPGSAFRLVNLSTPRRQMAYEWMLSPSKPRPVEEFHLKLDLPISAADMKRRRNELTRRTVAWLARQNRRITVGETLVLGQLDPAQVSAFAGDYFARTADLPEGQRGPSASSMMNMPYAMSLDVDLFAPASHGDLCELLADRGTKEAAPGMLKALAAGRFAVEAKRAGPRRHWIALLAIAQRDPWSDVDAQLAALVDRTDAVVDDGPQPVDVGACAAALLLARHDQDLRRFNLVAVASPPSMRATASSQTLLYRFTAAESRAAVRRWWAQSQETAPSRL